MKKSVAMAAYNGEKFIERQLASILPQLAPEDEVIISLDPSMDKSEEIIRTWTAKDSRITLLQGKGKGVIANFENAITAAKGEIIFLCDQDDVWAKNKVNEVVKAFDDHKNTLLILHDAVIVDGDLEEIQPSFFRWRGSKEGYFANLIKNSYIGCCMAFRQELKAIALPFPQGIPMHDQWLGLLAEKQKRVLFLDKPLLFYCRHGENVSADTHSSMGQMVKWRFRLWQELRKREKNVRK